MSVYYPTEIDFKGFEYGARVEYPNKDWSMPIYYYGEELTLQICKCKNLFGVMSYKNPQASAMSMPRYSTGICLDQNSKYVKSFVKVCAGIEDMVCDVISKHDQAQFVSTIKKNNRNESHLRIKLPVRYNQPQFGIYYNGNKISTTLDELREELYHGREINIMLTLASVWCSGKKCGISWRLAGIEFIAKNFRVDDIPKFPMKALCRSRACNDKNEQLVDVSMIDGHAIITPQKQAPEKPRPKGGKRRKSKTKSRTEQPCENKDSSN